MVTSVPAWFGRKAPTRKPAAVDLTITYDHSVSNNRFIEAFRSIDNIKAIENELLAEGVGSNAFGNRYSLCGFEFEMHTLLNNVPSPWVNAADLNSANLEWDDSRNVRFLGTSDEDETGAIYSLATRDRSTETLVTDVAADWPRTTNSWPSDQLPYGPVIDGTYRSRADNIGRIIISQSTEENAADLAIEGTYGIANGPINSDYNTDNRGPSTGGDNNTSFRDLADAMQPDSEYRQILVFIDRLPTSCTAQQDHIDAGLIPNSYECIGATYPNATSANVIYGPSDLATATIDDIVVVNTPISTIRNQGGGPGRANATNTGYYAELTNGATFNQNSATANFPLTFQILGRTLGKFLFDSAL